MSRRLRVLVLVALALSAALGVQKVSASSGPTHPRSLDGYTVSGVEYALTRSGTVGSLGFTLSPTAPGVRVRLSPRDAWHPCSVSGSRVVCPVGLPLTALKRLQVERV